MTYYHSHTKNIENTENEIFKLQPYLTEPAKRAVSMNLHYNDVIVSVIASQTGVSIVCSVVCSGANQRTNQSSASLAFVRGIHRSPVDSLTKGQ